VDVSIVGKLESESVGSEKLQLGLALLDAKADVAS